MLLHLVVLIKLCNRSCSCFRFSYANSKFAENISWKIFSTQVMENCFQVTWIYIQHYKRIWASSHPYGTIQRLSDLRNVSHPHIRPCAFRKLFNDTVDKTRRITSSQKGHETISCLLSLSEQRQHHRKHFCMR